MDVSHIPDQLTRTHTKSHVILFTKQSHLIHTLFTHIHTLFARLSRHIHICSHMFTLSSRSSTPQYSVDQRSAPVRRIRRLCMLWSGATVRLVSDWGGLSGVLSRPSWAHISHRKRARHVFSDSLSFAPHSHLFTRLSHIVRSLFTIIHAYSHEGARPSRRYSHTYSHLFAHVTKT